MNVKFICDAITIPVFTDSHGEPFTANYMVGTGNASSQGDVGDKKTTVDRKTTTLSNEEAGCNQLDQVNT